MRFFVGNNLSPLVAVHLNAAGHDAVHLREYDMGAPDATVLAAAPTRTGCWYLRTPTSEACWPGSQPGH